MGFAGPRGQRGQLVHWMGPLHYRIVKISCWIVNKMMAKNSNYQELQNDFRCKTTTNRERWLQTDMTAKTQKITTKRLKTTTQTHNTATKNHKMTTNSQFRTTRDKIMTQNNIRGKQTATNRQTGYKLPWFIHKYTVTINIPQYTTVIQRHAKTS